jgi:hypothetical protein
MRLLCDYFGPIISPNTQDSLAVQEMVRLWGEVFQHFWWNHGATITVTGRLNLGSNWPRGSWNDVPPIAPQLLQKLREAVAKVLADHNREKTNAPEIEEAEPSDTGKRSRRSTVKDEPEDRLISELTRHHQYANGRCGNLTPIGVRDLAKTTGIARSTISLFFQKRFQLKKCKGKYKGHDTYKIICRSDAQNPETKSLLAQILKRMNGEEPLDNLLPLNYEPADRIPAETEE